MKINNKILFNFKMIIMRRKRNKMLNIILINVRCPKKHTCNLVFIRCCLKVNRIGFRLTVQKKRNPAEECYTKKGNNQTINNTEKKNYKSK